MTRVDDFLDLVDNPARQALTPGHPADDALLALLVHVAFSDGEVDAGELAFLQRVLPGRDGGELVAWVQQVAAFPLDLDAVAAALPSAEERWKALRFAVRMAYKDGSVQDEERALLRDLAIGLRLGPASVELALGELAGRGAGVVAAERIAAVLGEVAWHSVQVLDEPVSGTLADAAPGRARPVRVIALDDVAVLALHERGLAAHFLEGTSFVAWRELVTYSRVPTIAAAVQLHTEDGGTWTLVDARLRGLAVVLDRLFGAEPPTGTAPAVERTEVKA
jgi:uncharacterized tellurite resistance protein B-like protein